MSDTSSTRRWLALAAFVTFVLSIAFLEQRVLPGVVDARSSLDELTYWQHHVERNGETAASHLRLGIAFERADRLDEAEDSYAAALALDSGYDAAAIGRYGVGAAKGDQDRALSELEGYARDHPRCVVCWQNLAAVYLNLRRLGAAEVAVEALLASDLIVESGMYSASNMEVEALVLAGRIQSARGDYSRAIGFFRDAIAADSRDARAYILQAKSLLASERPDDALEILDQAAGLAGRSERMQHEIARLQKRARRVRR